MSCDTAWWQVQCGVSGHRNGVCQDIGIGESASFSWCQRPTWSSPPYSSRVALSRRSPGTRDRESSWGGFIPGWQGDSPELWAVPLGFIFGCYTWSWFAAVRVGSYVLRRLSGAQRARPRWSQYLVVYLVAAAQCAVSELVFMRLGHWVYPTTVPGFTLWEGQYAWPWFNPFLYGLTWLALIWLRETAMNDDRGLSVIERGIDRLPVAGWQQTAMRFLSIFSFSSVVYILTYFLPFNLIMMHGTLNTHLPSYLPVP